MEGPAAELEVGVAEGQGVGVDDLADLAGDLEELGAGLVVTHFDGPTVADSDKTVWRRCI